jgi:hypothetical protein
MQIVCTSAVSANDLITLCLLSVIYAMPSLFSLVSCVITYLLLSIVLLVGRMAHFTWARCSFPQEGEDVFVDETLARLLDPACAAITPDHRSLVLMIVMALVEAQGARLATREVETRTHTHTHTRTQSHISTQTHTRTQSHRHTHILARAHTRTHTDTQSNTHTHTHARKVTYTHSHANTNIHTYTRARTQHARILTHTPPHTHTRARANAHTHTHTHTHTHIPPPSPPLVFIIYKCYGAS